MVLYPLDELNVATEKHVTIGRLMSRSIIIDANMGMGIMCLSNMGKGLNTSIIYT